MGEGCTDHMIQIRSSLRVTCKSRPLSKRKISHGEKVVRKYRKQSMEGVKLIMKVSLLYHLLFSVFTEML